MGVPIPAPGNADGKTNVQTARRQIAERLGITLGPEKPVVPRAKKPNCRYGHEYTPENTRIRETASGKTYRECITCNRAREQARWSRSKSEVVAAS
jgi:hypothetical protein